MAKAEVTLDLDGNEASVLLGVLQHVSGSEDGPRGCCSSIRRALERLNIPRLPNGCIDGHLSLLDNSIWRDR